MQLTIDLSQTELSPQEKSLIVEMLQHNAKDIRGLESISIDSAVGEPGTKCDISADTMIKLVIAVGDIAKAIREIIELVKAISPKAIEAKVEATPGAGEDSLGSSFQTIKSLNDLATLYSEMSNPGI